MPSKGKRKAGTHRMDGAIAALTPLGFSKMLVRETVRNFLKVYGDNYSGWYFIEEDYYKIVIDKLLEGQEGEDNEQHNIKNEEDETIASKEPSRVSAPINLDAGSSSSAISSTMKRLQARARIKLEESNDVLPRGELRQVGPSSVRKKSPSCGWISEEDELRALKNLQAKAQIKLEESGDVVRGDEFSRAWNSSIPKRRPSYGWLSEEEDDEEED